MEDSPPAKWEKWATDKKPSMKRRCENHDYHDRCIYMITMVLEGRKPLLGTLASAPQPHVELSPLGERVRQCWHDIAKYHPEVETMKLCVMPDHIHGILFVHERMGEHLGRVISGFKTGTRKAARELGILPALVAQATGQRQPSPTVPSTEQKAPSPVSRHSAEGRSHGLLWEPGYNDRILLHQGQLTRMLAYLDDNPRRLFIKRSHPEYFTRLGTLTVAGQQMEAMGNRFLLDNPVKIQIQCSRHLYSNEIEQKKAAILEQARREGAIVVSPCISPGEQQIATAAMAARIPLIVLLPNGFPPLFKPRPRYLEACSEGRLLMLAPFPFHHGKPENLRQRCLCLNALAANISDNG